jgi:hypothetical protein
VPRRPSGPEMRSLRIRVASSGLILERSENRWITAQATEVPERDQCREKREPTTCAIDHASEREIRPVHVQGRSITIACVDGLRCDDMPNSRAAYRDRPNSADALSLRTLVSSTITKCPRSSLCPACLERLVSPQSRWPVPSCP